MADKKKRFKWPMIIMACILFLLLIGKITQSIYSIDKEYISVKVNSEKIEKGIKLMTETKESDSYTSFMSIPFSKIEEIDQPINYWAIEQEESFYEEVKQTEVLLDEDVSGHFNLHTDVYQINDHIYNYALNVEHFLQNDRKYSQVKTYMIDLQTNSFLSFSDIFDTDKIKSENIWNLLNDDSKKQINETSFKENFSNLDNINWIVNNDMLIIYINPKQLEKSNDTLAVEIPLIKLHKNIKKPYLKIIISDSLTEEIKQVEKKDARKKLQLDKDGKYIALTFDDGPHDQVTQQILESLKQYDAKATFFMLSNNVKYYPDIANQVLKDGHELANHSESHVNLNATNKKRIDDELLNSKTVIEEVTGITPSLFRPPYGEYNQKVIDLANDSDQSIILWSIDTLDWKSRNAKSIYNITINKARPGAIVLMHDIHQTTADALPLVLNELSKQGYEFVTVSELLTLFEDEGIGPYYGN